VRSSRKLREGGERKNIFGVGGNAVSDSSSLHTDVSSVRLESEVKDDRLRVIELLFEGLRESSYSSTLPSYSE